MGIIRLGIRSMSVINGSIVFKVGRTRVSPSVLVLKKQFIRSFASEVSPWPKTSEELVRPKKIVKREPFVKNLFLGKFDKDVLTYPEVLDKEKLKTLEDMVAPIERFFEEEVDSKKIDLEAKIPIETMNALKELGMFGMQIPQEYGGLGFNATEFARLCETFSMDGSIGVTLAAHQSIGLKGIIIAGTEYQKSKYLPKLATGEHIAAFCLTEPSSGSDAASIRTQATLSADGKTFHLNGSKIWISNGGIADIFTVFAKTEVEDKGKKVDKVTAFIVERSFGGVTSAKPEDKMGIRGSNTTEVNFENTPVPIENVIGEVGGGFKIAMNILNSGRFSIGSSGCGAMKRVLGMIADHAINRVQFKRPLMDFELIQEKFAKITTLTYAMESMTYLTAGLIDSQDAPDCSVEAAIVKVFSSEALWYCASEALQILGGLGYMKEYPYERMLRDCRILLIFEGTNEILRMFIALMCCQHAGKELAESVRKIRNPLMNPGFVLNSLWNRRRHVNDNPKLYMDLPGQLHPSLMDEANQLEYCTQRLQYAVEIALQRHGKDIIEKQMDLKRLADIVIDIYAMTACLGRASRAYCIGLPNSDHEVRLAQTFCNDAIRRVKANVNDVVTGEYVNNEANYKKIAATVFKNKGYCASHPLSRNW